MYTVYKNVDGKVLYYMNGKFNEEGIPVLEWTEDFELAFRFPKEENAMLLAAHAGGDVIAHPENN
jgi:hypothetical protein